MNKIFKSFLIKELILSLLAIFLSGALFFSFPQKFSYIIIVMPIYFGVVFSFFHKNILNASQKKDAIFVSRYMLNTALKLFLNLIILVLLIYLFRANALFNSIVFIVYYFAFTYVELKELLSYFNEK